jgi:hypothetical protein
MVKRNFKPHRVVVPDKWASFVVGTALIADGIIRVTTLGHFAGRFAINATSWALKRDIERAKKAREKKACSTNSGETSSPS